MILNILHFFQFLTDFLSFSASHIQDAWLVYNFMHEHLKNKFKKVKTLRDTFWIQFLISILQKIQMKLIKYYDVIKDQQNLYFNLKFYLNSSEKLNYYRMNLFNLFNFSIVFCDNTFASLILYYDASLWCSFEIFLSAALLHYDASLWCSFKIFLSVALLHYDASFWCSLEMLLYDAFFFVSWQIFISIFN